MANLTDNRKEKKESLGIRNNNPINLRRSTIKWAGKVTSKTDTFEVFAMTWQGVRAGVLDMTNDIAKGKNTITKLIHEFAPPNENNTKAYIKTVSGAVGIGANTVIKKDDFNLFLKLVPAMIRIESGANASKFITTDDIQKGITEAFISRGYKLPTGVKNVVREKKKGTAISITEILIAVFLIIGLLLFLNK